MELLQHGVELLLAAPAEDDAFPERRNVGTLQPVQLSAGGFAFPLAHFERFGRIDRHPAVDGEAVDHIHLAVVRVHDATQIPQRLLSRGERRRGALVKLIRLRADLVVQRLVWLLTSDL